MKPVYLRTKIELLPENVSEDLAEFSEGDMEDAYILMAGNSFLVAFAMGKNGRLIKHLTDQT